MKKPFDKFINLNNYSLEKSEGFVVLNKTRMRPYHLHHSVFNYNFPEIPNADFYAKFTYDYNIPQQVATANLFNSLDIYCPPIFVAKLENDDKSRLMQLTQSVYNISDFKKIELANSISLFRTPWNVFDEKYHELFTTIGYLDDVVHEYNLTSRQVRWLPLYDPNVKAMFLSMMTPECFDNYINMLLVDTLRTESDRHYQNFFFYKTDNSEKFCGIIPIDHEFIHIYTVYFNSSFTFDRFINTELMAPSTIITLKTHASHKNRLLDICNLIQDGVLSQNNIQTLKKAIEYEFPKDILEECKKYKLTCQEDRELVYEPIAKLWEYNHSILSKEL